MTEAEIHETAKKLAGAYIVEAMEKAPDNVQFFGNVKTLIRWMENAIRAGLHPPRKPGRPARTDETPQEVEDGVGE